MKLLKEIAENKVVLLKTDPVPVRVKVLERIEGYDDNVFVIKVGLTGNPTSTKGMNSAYWEDGKTPVLKEYEDLEKNSLKK